MNKLTERKLVKLALTYKNGQMIEFDITKLVSLTTTFRTGVIVYPTTKVTNTLEIVLEYDELITYDNRAPLEIGINLE